MYKNRQRELPILKQNTLCNTNCLMFKVRGEDTCLRDVKLLIISQK